MKVKDLIDSLKICLEEDEDMDVFVEGFDLKGNRECFPIVLGARIEREGNMAGKAMIGPVKLPYFAGECPWHKRGKNGEY